MLTSIVTQSFALGIRAAAPLLTALLLSNLVLGLISRTLPQINVIAVGFSLNSLLALGVLFLSIGAVAWTFQEPTMDVMQAVASALVVKLSRKRKLQSSTRFWLSTSRPYDPRLSHGRTLPAKNRLKRRRIAGRRPARRARSRSARTSARPRC